jgi:hypothetical protein
VHYAGRNIKLLLRRKEFTLPGDDDGMFTFWTNQRIFEDALIL